MKKLILLFATAIIATTSSWAQIYMIDSFSLSTTDGGYGIYVNIDCEEWDEIYFDMDVDDPVQKTRMQLSGGEVKDLVGSLQSAIKLFESWEKTAKANGISLLSKKMPLKMDTQEIYFTQDGKWNMARSVELFVKFFIDENQECFAILETGPITSTEVVAKGFSIGSSHSLSGRWNLSWSRSQTTLIRSGDRPYLIFADRNDIEQFIGHLQKAIGWKNNNIAKGELLVRPKK